MDFQSMRVDELRQHLVKEYGYSEEQAKNVVGKSNVVQEILNNQKTREKTMPNDTEDFDLDSIIDTAFEKEDKFIMPDSDEIEILTSQFQDYDKNTGAVADPVTIPTFTDIGWTEYVLSQMDDSEKDKGYPKVHGLRRMVEKFLGEIINNSTRTEMAPSAVNGNHATITATVTVVKFDGQLVEMDGCADASDINMDRVYRKFPVSVAQSRAESRAYTRLLRLNVVSADELLEEEEGFEGFGEITDKQIKTIEKICGRTNINVEKLLQLNGVEGGLASLKESKAKELCGILITYEQTGPPEEILNESKLPARE